MVIHWIAIDRTSSPKEGFVVLETEQPDVLSGCFVLLFDWMFCLTICSNCYIAIALFCFILHYMIFFSINRLLSLLFEIP